MTRQFAGNATRKTLNDNSASLASLTLRPRTVCSSIGEISSISTMCFLTPLARKETMCTRFWYPKSTTISFQRRTKITLHFNSASSSSRATKDQLATTQECETSQRNQNYSTHEEDLIWDHLIQTMLNNKLRSKAIRENWILDRILMKQLSTNKLRSKLKQWARSSMTSEAQKVSRK